MLCGAEFHHLEVSGPIFRRSCRSNTGVSADFSWSAVAVYFPVPVGKEAGRRGSHASGRRSGICGHIPEADEAGPRGYSGSPDGDFSQIRGFCHNAGCDDQEMHQQSRIFAGRGGCFRREVPGRSLRQDGSGLLCFHDGEDANRPQNLLWSDGRGQNAGVQVHPHSLHHVLADKENHGLARFPCPAGAYFAFVAGCGRRHQAVCSRSRFLLPEAFRIVWKGIRHVEIPHHVSGCRQKAG